MAKKTVNRAVKNPTGNRTATSKRRPHEYQHEYGLSPTGSGAKKTTKAGRK